MPGYLNPRLFSIVFTSRADLNAAVTTLANCDHPHRFTVHKDENAIRELSWGAVEELQGLNLVVKRAYRQGDE